MQEKKKKKRKKKKKKKYGVQMAKYRYMYIDGVEIFIFCG